MNVDVCTCVRSESNPIYHVDLINKKENISRVNNVSVILFYLITSTELKLLAHSTDIYVPIIEILFYLMAS